MKQPTAGATGFTGNTATTLSEKCGISEMDEIRLAYAPLFRDPNSSTPIPAEFVANGNGPVPNKSCELCCWVYSDVHRSNRKTYDSHDIQRREADKRNPDPSNLVSEKLIGTKDLESRFDKQTKQSGLLREEQTKVEGALAVVERASRRLDDRVRELEAEQAALYHKYLAVLRKTELLRCRGSPVTSSEQRYRDQLARIVRAMQTPNLKIQELLIIQSQIDRSSQDVYGGAPSAQQVKQLCSTLDRQREGLQFLTDLLSKDARDVEIMRKKLSASQLRGAGRR